MSALATSLTVATQPTAKQTFSISPDLLIQLAMEEFNHLQSTLGQWGGKVLRSDTGIALAAFGNPNTSGGHGGKSNQQPQMAKNGKLFGICWTCGGM